jgi:type II pantothenate kinase
LASKQDVAVGIINLVFQTIGVLSIFAARTDGTRDIVLTGNLTNVPQSGEIFDGLTKLHQVRFHIPDYAEYATALGAAIVYARSGQYEMVTD